MEMVNKRVSSIGRTADESHARLERSILHQEIRLDDFFGRRHSQPESNTSYLLHWYSSLRMQQGGGLLPGSTLRASFDLSHINERLRLAIAGQDKPEPLAPSLPEDPGSPGFDRTFQGARLLNTELRYQFIHSDETDLFLGAGVKLALPPQVFARASYQYVYRISEVSLLRFGETVFARTPDGEGETTEFSLERLLNPRTILRCANSGTVSREIKGVEWGSEFSLIRELSTRSAVTVTAGAYGNTSLNDWMNNYLLRVRYRRNFLRSWLFYELEPEMSWPRQPDGSFASNYALTLRLDIVFQGKEKRATANP